MQTREYVQPPAYTVHRRHKKYEAISLHLHVQFFTLLRRFFRARVPQARVPMTSRTPHLSPPLL